MLRGSGNPGEVKVNSSHHMLRFSLIEHMFSVIQTKKKKKKKIKHFCKAFSMEFVMQMIAPRLNSIRVVIGHHIYLEGKQ